MNTLSASLLPDPSKIVDDPESSEGAPLGGECAVDHAALKRGPLAAFQAAVEVNGTLDGVRPIGACKVCHSSIVFVGRRT